MKNSTIYGANWGTKSNKKIVFQTVVSDVPTQFHFGTGGAQKKVQLLLTMTNITDVGTWWHLSMQAKSPAV